MAKRLDKIQEEVSASNFAFLNYLERNIDAETSSFLKTLSKLTEIYVFSGVIRNFFLDNNNIRDLDLVIENDIDLSEHFPNINFKKNSFGGFKFNINEISIDLWALEKTWALQYQKTIDFNDLNKYIPSTAFFNFSAVVFSIQERKFYPSQPFLSFLRDKEINYVFKPNLNYSLCVVNSLYYSNEYNLKIADKLKNFLKVLSKRNLNYQEAQLKHFGKILYSDEQIKNWIDNLKVRKKYKIFK